MGWCKFEEKVGVEEGSPFLKCVVSMANVQIALDPTSVKRGTVAHFFGCYFFNCIWQSELKSAHTIPKTKHWIGKYIGMHPGMSLALATFTNHSPKLPYLSNCITLVKIFFWKHRVNFVHYVLLPTEQAETYLKIYYLTHILRRVVKKKPLADRGGSPPP